jgi:serine/threonine-protein kinase
MGSPAYASPEQSAGKPVDQRSDIYAVGVMLHELVTGRLPFLCEHVADLLMKQISAPPPRLSDELLATDIGRAMDAIIQACLVKDPTERVLSAAQLGDMFGRLAAGDHALPDGIRRPRRLQWMRTGRRGRAIAPAVALAALSFLAAFAVQQTRAIAPLPVAPIFPAPLVARGGAPAPIAETTKPPPAPSIDEQRARATAPRPHRAARTPLSRVSKAMTLDPYR